MLTLFSIPKPFHGHTGVIQRNALESWALLKPACEILLLGEDEGVAEAAKEFGATHIPHVAKNEHGTPLISAIFAQAQAQGRHERQCYVNADIILMNDFARAMERVAHGGAPSVAIGSRWDCDIKEPLNFSAGWEETLRADALARGNRQRDWLIDYFCFTRGVWGDIPPFAVGRTVWDNWLLYRARAAGARLVDVTPVVVAIHQNHDYGHIKSSTQGAYKGPEAARNLELAGGEAHCFSIKDATHVLTPQGLRRALDRDQFRRYLSRIPTLQPNRRWLARVTDRYFRSPARVFLKLVDALTYERV